MKRFALISGALFLVGAALLLSLMSQGNHPNVVLITIDSVRPDHLGCYGYGPETSPTIDSLAAEGVLFEHVRGLTNDGLSQQVSLLSSLPQRSHAVLKTGPVVPALPWLPSMLGQAGYSTAAFVTYMRENRKPELGRGFDIFHEYQMLYTSSDERLFHAALTWLEEQQNAPFFLWIHVPYPHFPMTPPKNFQEEFLDGRRVASRTAFSNRVKLWLKRGARLTPTVSFKFQALYDGEIRLADELVAGVLDRLHIRGLYDETLIMITSDIGYNLVDRAGIRNDTHQDVREGELRVPWIMRLPQGRLAGARVKAPVSTLDQAPTLFDLLGLEIPAEFQGRSALPLLEGRAESLHEQIVSEDWEPDRSRACLLEGDLKLIDVTGFPAELYDLLNDPGERHDLAAEQPYEVERLQQALEAWKERTPVDLASMLEAGDEAAASSPP